MIFWVICGTANYTSYSGGAWVTNDPIQTQEDTPREHRHHPPLPAPWRIDPPREVRLSRKASRPVVRESRKNRSWFEAFQINRRKP